MKILERFGVPRNRIIDGLAFKIPNLNFPRLLNEGVVYGVLDDTNVGWKNCFPINYKRVYNIKNKISKLILGKKSYINNANIYGNVSIKVDNYSCIAWDIKFIFGQGEDHNYRNVSIYGLSHFSWKVPKEFYPSIGLFKNLIGNDV